MISGSLAVYAQLPADALFVEAETMIADQTQWKTRRIEGYYGGYVSGKAWLESSPRGEGTATAALQCPAAGKYHIWVRYSDALKRNAATPFQVTVTQSEQRVRKEFNTASLRTDADGQKRWGNRVHALVWDCMEVDLEPGAFELMVSKNGAANMIDCFLITRDLTYLPYIEDCFPLYMKIEAAPDSEKAWRYSLWGRKADGKYYWEHVSLQLPFARRALKGGEASEWVYISNLLALSEPGTWNRLVVSAFGSKRQEKAPAANYNVYFSTTPDEKGIVKKVERRGRGPAAAFKIVLTEREQITSDLEESAANLQRSMADQAYGKRPEKFPVATQAIIDTLSDETLRNEIETLRNIGVNIISFAPEYADRFSNLGWNNVSVSFRPYHLQTTVKGIRCGRQPKKDAIVSLIEGAEKTAASYPPGINVTREASLADEPRSQYLRHVTECPVCIKAFPQYLKQQQVPLEELQENSYNDIKPSADRSNAVLFYWSSRYGIDTSLEFFKFCTRTAEAKSPDWKTKVNFAGEIRGNMVAAGMDWFELYRQGALTTGYHEDYSAWMKNYQIRGYYMAVMRAACAPYDRIFGPLACFPSNTQWEFIAAGFSQLGQGAKKFTFFNYGPHYIPTSSPCSALQWVHNAARHVTYAIGAVEDQLLNAEVVKGDAAMLLSTTGDLWQANPSQPDFTNPYGMERTFLYLLLRHLHVRVDILPEEDLASRLAGYKLLLVTDTHIRREYVPALREWVRNGGVLYAGANALSFDEYNRPLSLLDEMGIVRGALEGDANLAPGRPPYEMAKRKVLGQVDTAQKFGFIIAAQNLRGGAVVFRRDNGQNALTVSGFGQGKLAAGGIFPALAYIYHAQTDSSLKLITPVNYPEGPRQFIEAVVKASGITPSVTAGDALLEPNLLRRGKTLLIALANWSGREIESTLTLRGMGSAAGVKALRSTVKLINNNSDEVVIDGTFGNGDFIIVEMQ